VQEIQELQDDANHGSSPETVLDVITKVTTGSEDVLTMLSTSLATDYQLLKSKQH
jgi:hypothetical protein